MMIERDTRQIVFLGAWKIVEKNLDAANMNVRATAGLSQWASPPDLPIPELALFGRALLSGAGLRPAPASAPIPDSPVRKLVSFSQFTPRAAKWVRIPSCPRERREPYSKSASFYQIHLHAHRAPTHP